MGQEVVDATLSSAKLDSADIGVIHVANAFGEMFAAQAAAVDALGRARVSLDDLDGIEVHDCFTPSEYLAIDHIGLIGGGRPVAKTFATSSFGGSTATTVSFVVRVAED